MLGFGRHLAATNATEGDDGHGHSRKKEAIIAEIILQIIFVMFLIMTYWTFKKNK